jgi:hypothetical protein
MMRGERKVSSMNLRQAARRTSRSITTLRRYIRGGRLVADKKPGRFGPEYFVSEQALTEAGLEPAAADRPGALSRRAPKGLEPFADRRSAERLSRDSVPLVLYQELQMKHEQLLVQYGMVRAGGAKVLDLRAELEAKRRQLDEARHRADRLQRELNSETTRLRRMLHQSELEQEGRGLEIAALEAKVRALELLTRNSRPDGSVEQQVRNVLEQKRRVERLDSSSAGGDSPAKPWPDGPGDRDH